MGSRITDETVCLTTSHIETAGKMRKLYYFAAYPDSECLLVCDHEHNTVIAAVVCISSAGGYVIAVENGRLRALTDAEEAEFQHAMYGPGKAGSLDDIRRSMFKLRFRLRINEMN